MKRVNKTIGNKFEEELCRLLAEHGWWAHNMAQNQTGQPADVIAVKNGIPVLIDCKDCANNIFTLSRIEANQEGAMRDDWEVVQEPKEEKTYPFGYAISELKNGKKVARKGWNGKGMFLVLCPGNKVPVDHMKVKEVKKFYQNEKQDTVTINPHIDMKAADGTYVTGWLASQTDMLADDWYVVE